jgi:hypothetical protein
MYAIMNITSRNVPRIIDTKITFQQQTYKLIACGVYRSDGTWFSVVSLHGKWSVCDKGTSTLCINWHEALNKYVLPNNPALFVYKRTKAVSHHLEEPSEFKLTHLVTKATPYYTTSPFDQFKQQDGVLPKGTALQLERRNEFPGFAYYTFKHPFGKELEAGYVAEKDTQLSS